MTEDTKKTIVFLVLYRVRNGTESFSIISYLLVTLSGQSHWKKLLNAIQCRSEATNEKIPVTKNNGKLITAIALLFHLILLIVFGVECFFLVQENIDLKNWIITCYVRVHLYLKLVTAIFVICSTKILATLFNDVNEILREEKKNLLCSSSTEMRIAKHLREIGTLFGTYCDIVDEFNTIFGWPLFLLLTYSVLVILLEINAILVLFGSNAFKLQDEFGNMAMMVLLMVSNDAGDMGKVFITLIVMSCDTVHNEASKIPDSYFNLQRGMPKGCLKEEILILVKYTKEQVPAVSAAGFYHISQSLLPVIISTITSYLLICIQINMYV
ncbi:hypothetical protein JTB14_008698 [Gonioctena quinquepunctata]|nr:hypothetical protein JTB14_008698 [Gonioctena quinquepunctata]